MATYAMRRLLSAIPVIFGVLTITFAVMYLLPGDPASIMLARSGASADQIARLRAELGLDDPLLTQYLRYMGNALQGDFGHSISSQEAVFSKIMKALPKTLELALAAMLIALPLGTLLGVVAAIRQDTWIDRSLVGLSSIGVAMPSFWFGLMLILLFSVTLKWLPASGQGSLKQLILPAIVLGLGAMGTATRTARASMVEILRQDYLRTARAKGLANRAVITRHALRNALIPIITMVGLLFGWLVTGSFIVEMVFARQGLGQVLITAIQQKDLPVVQGAVLYTSLLYIILNLVVDLSYGLVDPRIHYS
jgi:peptide/nickel transport system permease protein